MVDDRQWLIGHWAEMREPAQPKAERSDNRPEPRSHAACTIQPDPKCHPTQDDRRHNHESNRLLIDRPVKIPTKDVVTEMQDVQKGDKSKQLEKTGIRH